MDYSLRGKCEEMSKALVESDSTLTLVRGWYDDPIWGRQEHWWTKKPDGTIVDPTSAQFPVGGIASWYTEFDGIVSCEECGKDVKEADAYMGRLCSARCYGRMVGVYT
jgi:hypothetical protein